MELKVATFNIRHCLGRDGVVDVARVASVITAIEPDVIALQEVDRVLARSGGVDQSVELAAATGLRFVFAPAFEDGEGSYGIALGSTSEPAEPEIFSLPRLGGEEPRVALVARVGDLSVLTTHLAVAPSPRDIQLRALALKIQRIEGDVLLLGDMNTGRGGLRHLRDVGLTPGPRLATMSWWRGIDHILTSRGLAARDHHTIKTDASDHRPLVATLSA